MATAADKLDTAASNRSIKVDLPLDHKPSTIGRLPTRRRKIQERLAALDTDHDGVISKEELEHCIEDAISTEVQLKYLKWGAAIMLVFLALLIAAVAGLTYGIVDSIKDTKSSGGALADKGSSSTLRTASGGFVQPAVTVTNSTRRRRLLANPAAVPVGDVSTSTVAQYCAYLAEGVSVVPTSPSVLDGGSTTSHDDVSNLQITRQVSCVDWATENAGKPDPPAPSTGIEGSFKFDGGSYTVSCKPGARSCTITQTSAPTAAPTGNPAPAKRITIVNGTVTSATNGSQAVADSLPAVNNSTGRKLQQAATQYDASSGVCGYHYVVKSTAPFDKVRQAYYWKPFQDRCATCPNNCGRPEIQYSVTNEPICSGCDFKYDTHVFDLDCSKLCYPSCFPGDASVQARRLGDPETVRTIRMNELQIGDKVLTQHDDGGLTFEEVYVFGHKDPAAAAQFVRLTIQGSDLPLELSPGHFLPVSNPAASGAPIMQRAKDVAVGDAVWAAQPHGGFEKRTIVKVDAVNKQGLFNPLTMGGKLVVNGVLASAHSEWFLDGMLPDRFAFRLPAIYQVVLAPARALYRVFGAVAARNVDASVNFAATGTNGFTGFLKAVAGGFRGCMVYTLTKA